ncbi:hypothetical protein [Thorsellia anophelis]|uniref:Uncharacterized protein n=1 Tax=Thorsellia anophelis DSM 18579 TaxID=1123402 RepID=A0A1I0ABI6_9GAMM|nr:hypothetical protein [Thorsellia anophelis]SES91520.1 hypothetical protein SAMN02583745_00875 [Thorsellia anophelis DSM 18579]
MLKSMRNDSIPTPMRMYWYRLVNWKCLTQAKGIDSKHFIKYAEQLSTHDAIGLSISP